MTNPVLGRTFAVVGATGKVGAATVDALREAGHDVLGVCRNPENMPAGTTAIKADLTKPEMLSGRLEGVDGIFVPAHRNLDRVLASACTQGVSQVVLLSAAAAECNDTNAISSHHRRAEQAVAASGMDWSILRPQAFASNALSWAPAIAARKAVPLPFWDLPIAYVDPADIGQVASILLTTSGHGGRTYRLSGPTALMPEEALAQVSSELKRPVNGVRLDDVATREFLLTSNPVAVVDAFFRLYRGQVLDESIVTHDIRKILGRCATPFSTWVKRHLHLFA